MFFFPSSFLFIFFMVLGVLISISSSNLFLIWCGLEMNLMGFIPIIIQQKQLGEIESSVKYFLVQSLGSSLFLLGSSISVFVINFSLEDVCSILIISGLMIKLGMFPFYFWLAGVMSKMSWVSCLLLTTWQKLAPLGVLMFFQGNFPSSIIYLGAGGSLLGGLMGMNQVNMKSLLAYSSIGHMGWMLGSLELSVMVGIFYLFMYIIVNIIVFIVIMNSNFNSFTVMKNSSGMLEFSVLILGFSFLVLGGFPPFAGFFPKLLSISLFFYNGYSYCCILFILGSCFSLYYYISIVLSCTSTFYSWGSVLDLKTTLMNLLFFSVVFFSLFSSVVFFSLFF